MGALSDLLFQSPTAATPATPATLRVDSGPVSQESQESQGGTSERRMDLLTLADLDHAEKFCYRSNLT